MPALDPVAEKAGFTIGDKVGIAYALWEFQKKAPSLHKDDKAEIKTKTGGTFSYTFVSLGKVMEIIKPILAECGLSVVQAPTMVEMGGMLVPALRTRILYINGDSIEDTMPLMVSLGVTPQDQGSAITYARRYALMAMLGLVADEDDDAAKVSAKGKGKAAAPPPIEDNRDLMPELTEALARVSKWDNWSVPNVIDQAKLQFDHKIEKLEDMEPSEMQLIIDAANAWFAAHKEDPE